MELNGFPSSGGSGVGGFDCSFLGFFTGSFLGVLTGGLIGFFLVFIAFYLVL